MGPLLFNVYYIHIINNIAEVSHKLSEINRELRAG